ncbi:MAG: flavocytochrome C, partial [Clostridia bacterium]
MKSRKIKLSIAIISLIMLACGSQEKSIIGKGNGFSGEIKVNVVTENNKIKNLEVIENNETSHIISRAFPILKERI